jgi:hypothetical protein
VFFLALGIIANHTKVQKIMEINKGLMSIFIQRKTEAAYYWQNISDIIIEGSYINHPKI